MRRAITVLALLLFGSIAGFAQNKGDTFPQTRMLLAKMETPNFKSTLSDLFEVGDERIPDLIRALDDKEEPVSLNAQRVIRYLNNPSGMKALVQWYGRTEKESGRWVMSGTVPTPINDWDLEFIKKRDRLSPEFIYALVLDESPAAQPLRSQAFAKSHGMTDSCTGPQFRGVRDYKPIPFPDGGDIAKQVADNAFFICPSDRQFVASRLMAYNGKKDKALIYLKIDRGVLAEEWYHIVVEKSGAGWRFVSISQVAVS